MGLFSQKGSTAALVLRNTTAAPIEIMVEPYPDRYLLQRGDEFAIEAPTGAPFDLSLYDGGVQIWPGNGIGRPVRINGQRATPDWTTEI